MRLTLLLLALFGCAESKTSEQDQDDGHDGHGHGDESLPADFDPSTELVTESGVTVSYTTSPDPIPESELFEVIISASSGTVMDADASMPTHGGHGMTVDPVLTDNEDGTVTAAPFEFHMPGYWLIQVTVADEEGNEEQVRFDVDCCE